MRKFIFILALIVTPFSHGCEVPMGGEDFDRLVQVKSLGKNTFKITIPKKAKDLDFGVSAGVAYRKKNTAIDHIKQIEIKPDGNNYIATVEVKPVPNLAAHIMAIWEPKICCLCGAVGYSKKLVLN